MNKIIVAGDILLDKFKWNVEKEGNAKYNWELYKVYNTATKWGGAFLLANMIEKSCKIKKLTTYNKAKIKEQNNEEQNFVESLSILEECNKRTFMTEFSGHNLPGTENNLSLPNKEELFFPKIKECNKINIIVIHDAGNKFREETKLWPPLEKYNIIIHKMNRPVAEGKLWEDIKDKKGLIVVIDVNDLRERGLRISRGLSWERTAHDFIKEMKNIKTKYPELKSLLECENLIIRFGVDGAIHYQKENNSYCLYFDPDVFEGSFENQFQGKVQGKGNAFISGLVYELKCKVPRNTKQFDNKIKQGIKRGLLFSRILVKDGYKEFSEIKKSNFPFKTKFDISKEDMNKIRDENIPDDPNWKILEQALVSENSEDKINKIRDVACDIVLNGKSTNLKASMAVFGKLKTADRNEIESYHSIKNLINEYLNKKVNKPLSIAVFGPPGSGKSFGVTEIANTISSDIEKLTFNLSQFQSPNDLLSAFHIVQSTVLKGKIPLVFFDEFDCNLENVDYGWLRYFLSPMNDGEFKQGESLHPIGKSIFVFAGGTSETFASFNPGVSVKGSDFKSRLRGYVNIMGINKENVNRLNKNYLGLNRQNARKIMTKPSVPTLRNRYDNKKYYDDKLYMIRRAMALRTMLEDVAGNIFDKDIEGNKTKANIDKSVLNALIKVPEYKHGIRSMRAIIEMSVLSEKQKFERSALPSSQQLELHVDADEFKGYLNEQ